MNVIHCKVGLIVECKQAASTFAEAFNALLDAYQRIGENMPLFAEYQALFDSDPKMRQILELYYQDIFEFHQRAINYFKCSGSPFLQIQSF
jgi:hypothetical protein